MTTSEVIKELNRIFDETFTVEVPNVESQQIGVQFVHHGSNLSSKILDIRWYLNGVNTEPESFTTRIVYNFGFDISIGAYDKDDIPFIQLDAVDYLIRKLSFLEFKDIDVSSDNEVFDQQRGNVVTVTASYSV